MPFNPLNTKHIDQLRTVSSAAFDGLESDVAKTVQQIVDRGISKGQSANSIARQLQSSLGLSPKDEHAAANFRGLLETGDRAALTRELRDKRFDSAIRKAFDSGKGLTTKQIDQMVAGYIDGAARERARTVAHTAVSDGHKEANLIAIDEAVAAGDLDPANWEVEWVATDDERTRPTHRNRTGMGGKRRPLDGAYSSGQRYPGEGEHGCRCREKVVPKRSRSRRRR